MHTVKVLLPLLLFLLKNYRYHTKLTSKQILERLKPFPLSNLLTYILFEIFSNPLDRYGALPLHIELRFGQHIPLSTIKNTVLKIWLYCSKTIFPYSVPCVFSNMDYWECVWLFKLNKLKCLYQCNIANIGQQNPAQVVCTISKRESGFESPNRKGLHWSGLFNTESIHLRMFTMYLRTRIKNIKNSVESDPSGLVHLVQHPVLHSGQLAEAFWYYLGVYYL